MTQKEAKIISHAKCALDISKEEHDYIWDAAIEWLKSQSTLEKEVDPLVFEKYLSKAFACVKIIGYERHMFKYWKNVTGTWGYSVYPNGKFTRAESEADCILKLNERHRQLLKQK